jgi:3-isopropylmalate/(R)-2-methylmalate dehydratase small subunit
MKHSRIWKMGNNIDTDQVIASQYLQIATIDEMKKYTFETFHPDFSENFKSGDIIVAGENFGCGSSREQAPAVIKAIGAEAVVAKSFAKFFSEINQK